MFVFLFCVVSFDLTHPHFFFTEAFERRRGARANVSREHVNERLCISKRILSTCTRCVFLFRLVFKFYSSGLVGASSGHVKEAAGPNMYSIINKKLSPFPKQNAEKRGASFANAEKREGSTKRHK